MNEVFESIAYFFEEILLAPFDALRALEDESWWLANTISWVSILVLVVALGYWMKQLHIFDQSGEEDRSQTAHSFLGKNQK